MQHITACQRENRKGKDKWRKCNKLKKDNINFM